jgi:hypothetical protein
MKIVEYTLSEIKKERLSVPMINFIAFARKRVMEVRTLSEYEKLDKIIKAYDKRFNS